MAPAGIVKFKNRLGVTPVILALAWLPGVPVVTVPIVIVGVAPVGPVAPTAPVGPVAPAAPVGPVAPAGPVGPVAPAGILKVKTAFSLVPVLDTVAGVPGSPVVVVPTATVTGPAGPVGPVGPILPNLAWHLRPSSRIWSILLLQFLPIFALLSLLFYERKINMISYFIKIQKK